MGKYAFECVECGFQAHVFAAHSERPTIMTCACGAVMERDYSGMRIHINTGQADYLTSDITGEIVRISTKNQERELCKRNGVRRVTALDRDSKKRPKKMAKNPESMRDSYAKMAQKMGVNV